MKTSHGLIGIACVVLASTACSGGSGDDNGDYLGEPPAHSGTQNAAFRVVPRETDITIEPGATRKLEVSIDRQQGFSGAVQLRVTGFDSGVVASGSEIPAGATTTEISFVASTDTPIGQTRRGKIVGTSGTMTAEAEINVTVQPPAGTLDNAFGTNGAVTMSYRAGDESFVYGIAVQNDGKIVLGGWSSIGGFDGTDSLAVARLEDSGALDTSFNGTGTSVITVPGRKHGAAQSLVLAPDGKILLGGRATPDQGRTDFVVARVNTDGTADGTFGESGTTYSEIGPSSEMAYDVHVQPDGKPILVGFSSDSDNGDEEYFAFARYGTDGKLDSSFDSDGKKTIKFADNVRAYPDASALQPDGKIVAIGHVGNSNDGWQLGAARVNPDGSDDASFGTGGKMTTALGGDTPFPNRILVAADGSSWVAGTLTAGTGSTRTSSAFLAKLTPNGTLDPSFGNGGFIKPQLDGYHSNVQLGVDRQGRFVLVMTYRPASMAPSSDERLLIARLAADGSLDASYGEGGSFKIDAKQSVRCITQDALGRIVVGGMTSDNKASLTRIWN